MSVSQQEWEFQKDRGAQRARAGGKRTDCPFFGTGRDAELREEAWLSGFDEAVKRRRA